MRHVTSGAPGLEQNGAAWFSAAAVLTVLSLASASWLLRHRLPHGELAAAPSTGAVAPPPSPSLISPAPAGSVAHRRAPRSGLARAHGRASPDAVGCLGAVVLSRSRRARRALGRSALG